MALTLTVSQRELERQQDLAFKQREYKIFLAINPTDESAPGYDPDRVLTAESPASDWLARELVPAVCPGYYANFGVLGGSIWNENLQRSYIPEITAVFKAERASWSYNTVCFWLLDEMFLHSINVEDPEKILDDGQVAAYSYAIQNFVES